eukprot:scaffold83286_cov68-Phaeocystis_antarctica.AAC.4
MPSHSYARKPLEYPSRVVVVHAPSLAKAPPPRPLPGLAAAAGAAPFHIVLVAVEAAHNQPLMLASTRGCIAVDLAHRVAARRPGNVRLAEALAALTALVPALHRHAGGQRARQPQHLGGERALALVPVDLLTWVLPVVEADRLHQHGRRLVKVGLCALHGEVADAQVEREVGVQVREVAAIEHLDGGRKPRQQGQVHHAGAVSGPEHVGFADHLGLVGIGRALEDDAIELVARLATDHPLQPLEHRRRHVAPLLPRPAVQLLIEPHVGAREVGDRRRPRLGRRYGELRENGRAEGAAHAVAAEAASDPLRDGVARVEVLTEQEASIGCVGRAGHPLLLIQRGPKHPGMERRRRGAEPRVVGRNLPHQDLADGPAGDLPEVGRLEEGHHRVGPVADVRPEVGRASVRNVHKPRNPGQPCTLARAAQARIGLRRCPDDDLRAFAADGPIDVHGVPPLGQIAQVMLRRDELDVPREERRVGCVAVAGGVVVE